MNKIEHGKKVERPTILIFFCIPYYRFSTTWYALLTKVEKKKG